MPQGTQRSKRVPFKQYVLKAGRTVPLSQGLGQADRDFVMEMFEAMPNDLLLKIAPLMNDGESDKAIALMAEYFCAERQDVLARLKARNQEMGR